MTLPSTALLQSALSEALAKPVVVTDLQRLTAGATKQTWRIAANVGAAPQAYILQTVAPTRLHANNGTPKRTLSPEQDAKITQLAHTHGVPVPGLVLKLEPAHGLGLGQITAFVAGETLAPKILRDARFETARQRLTGHCAQALAAIHRIPAPAATFLPRLDATRQWQDNRALVDASGVRHAALEWGLRWVEERLGAHQNPALATVHGDFRLGNLIVNETGLAAVIDWELAHLGDPLQDLAWLCLRTWRFGGPHAVGGFGQRETLYADYAQHSGNVVDRQGVFFWEMACQVRWSVMCLGMGIGGMGHGALVAQPQRVSLEHRLIGRRMEEPLWDMVQMVKTARQQGDAV